MDNQRQARVPQPLQAGITYWLNFVSRCISQRLEVDQFEEFVVLVHTKYPLPPNLIVDFFLRPQPHNDETIDPRIPPYIAVLTRLGYANPISILNSLWKYSSSQEHLLASLEERRSHRKRQGQQHQVEQGPVEHDAESNNHVSQKASLLRWKSSYWAEEVMFYHVLKLVMGGHVIPETQAALDLVAVLSKWMRMFAAASDAFAADMMTGLHETPSPRKDEMETARSAFLPLLLRLVDNDTVLKAIAAPKVARLRNQLSDAMRLFIPTLQSAPQFVARLQMIRAETLQGAEADEKKGGGAVEDIFGSAVQLSSFEVQEIPLINARPGLYIYIHACLCGRPLIDDHGLLSYLNNRYQGDTQASAIDLILASFDVIENAISRNEGNRDAYLLKSFLINKVPLLLCHLCPPAFSTSSAEFCISQALQQVDTSMFPTASLMFDESRNNNQFTESVREEFCNACALHGLIERDHVDRILGERSMSFEASLQKQSKDKLIQDCSSDPQKIQGLVRELDKMDGNVGAISQALVEVIRQLCQNKDTMTLKVVCAQLVAKPLSIDVILLFEKLSALTEPVVQLLDSWKYDEDQGEYQPVYEEFGGILLLILAITYRYDLSASDLGLSLQASSTGRILNQAHLGRTGSELTEQENKHLEGWIHGLFDSEAGGLGDDLMSSCMPQDFYMLIAPLFQNILVAYSRDVLSDEALKSGVEYLVDTFLLPCLVPAVRYLCDYLKVNHGEHKAIIKVLQLVLQPSSISGEASTMLTSVKNLIAEPLERSLRAYQRKDLQNQDIEPLLTTLKDHRPLSTRGGKADLSELESWIGTSSSGISGCIHHLINNCIQWSLSAGINSTPTSFSQRLMNAAVEVCGAKRILSIMLDELRQQTEPRIVSIAYDIVTAIICAPDVSRDLAVVTNNNTKLFDSSGVSLLASRRGLGLQATLKSMAEQCKTIQKKDAALAETVVRLYRRVDAQLSFPAQQTLLTGADLDMGLSGGDANALGNAMAALGDAAAAVGTSGADAMSMDAGLDMGSLGDLRVPDDPAGAGDLDGVGADDIFGGLNTNDINFEDWDSLGNGMDLS